MLAEHRLRDGGQLANKSTTARGRSPGPGPGGNLLALHASAGNRAVGRLITGLTVQRCGPNSDCDCPPEEKLAAELKAEKETAEEPVQTSEGDAAATAMPVQRDRMAASGFSQPLNEQEELSAAHRKTADGKPVTNCWEPQSQDFKAAAGGPAIGSFDEFITTLKSRARRCALKRYPSRPPLGVASPTCGQPAGTGIVDTRDAFPGRPPVIPLSRNGFRHVPVLCGAGAGGDHDT